ncbi:MAG: DUF4169 family protein [Alphaproteobacteria bacterium]|nr:DUF4169 family protein [Alphaproteobacteria bacterium]
MTHEIVNLRQFRKRRERENAEQQAADNRRQHGRSKSERQLTGAKALLEKRRLDGHLLQPNDEGQPAGSATESAPHKPSLD